MLKVNVTHKNRTLYKYQKYISNKLVINNVNACIYNVNAIYLSIYIYYRNTLHLMLLEKL